MPEPMPTVTGFCPAVLGTSVHRIAWRESESVDSRANPVAEDGQERMMLAPERKMASAGAVMAPPLSVQMVNREDGFPPAVVKRPPAKSFVPLVAKLAE